MIATEYDSNAAVLQENTAGEQPAGIDQPAETTGEAAAAPPGGSENGPADPPAPPDAETPAVDTPVDIPLDLAARTLAGDQRDPWHKLGEAQQSFVAQRVETRCHQVVRQAVGLVAARDFPAIVATLKEPKIKDGIEAKVILSRHDRHRHALMDAAGSEVLILLADPQEYLNARGPAKIDADEPTLPLEPSEPAGDAIGHIDIAVEREEDDGHDEAEALEPVAGEAAEQQDEATPFDAPEATDASGSAREYFRDLGRQAALRGEPQKSNPFPRKIPAHKSWADGWKAGTDAAAQLAAADAESALANGEATAP